MRAWSVGLVALALLGACGGDDDGGDAGGPPPDPETDGPTVEDHWHLAYGFDVCDRDGIGHLEGALEELDASGIPVNAGFYETGIHSHDDGVIHWHAVTARATGDNATLGVFLDNYGVELTDEALTFPSEQFGGAEYIEGATECGGVAPGSLAVAVWPSAGDTGPPDVYREDMTEVHVDRDGMVVLVSYQPDGVDLASIEVPPWAADLGRLGEVDQAG